ncbi:hypothetical protein [uncultured Sutterella sp.]|uniref:hypothetical protein n=1 Tax=uncultured Sutterella sp. TaxID=286133 RepID=UPI00261300E1|nr:hypothetical protein [uncultured Sutterella sp.]
MQALWQELLDFAQTPAGLLILAAAAFVLASFLITGLIFFIASLFKKKSPLAVQTSEDALQEKTPEESASSTGDPLESFDRRSLKAPIALARLRAQGPDITEAAEPMMPGSAPQPAAPERDLTAEEKPQAEPAASAPAAEPAPEPPQPAPFASAPITPKLPDPFGRANFLLTLPFERRVGLSMAHADLCGAGIEAVFFDPEAVSRWDDVTLRLVPFLPQGSGKLLITESDRETFSSGDLFAQPDAVIELSSGLIALEYKSKGGRSEDPLRWAEAMRTKDILQTVINALVLSAESGRPSAPVLRTNNAVFFIRPSMDLRKVIEAKLGDAKQFLSLSSSGSGAAGISASDYSELLTPIVAKLFPRPMSSGSLIGMKAHEEMLARR